MKIILTLTGPSAGGKSVLERALAASGHFDRVVSHTTRPPRDGELEANAYQFVSLQEMLAMRARGEFVESAQYSGHWYGTSKAEFERIFAAGKTVLVVVEPQGRDSLREVAASNGWTVVSAFVDCPVELQAERLVNRMMEQMDRPEPIRAKAIAELKKRMVQAITVEPAWRSEAREKPALHEVYVPVSDEQNMAKAMDMILTRCGHAPVVA